MPLDVQAALEQLHERKRLRPDVSNDHTGLLNFSSNDFFGLSKLLAHDPAPAGSGASRLVTGDHDLVRALERKLADWLQREAALVFSSGYAANLGTLQALGATGPLTIFSDELNHASIIDGIRLSRTDVVVYPHLDLDQLELLLGRKRNGRSLIVTESVFSMDGDCPDLPRLASLAQKFDAVLMVDEAHAMGVLGPAGRGLCAEAGIVPDLLVVTFGKALGVSGAAVLCSHSVRTFLWNHARSLIYSTGFSPLLASIVSRSVSLVAGSEGDQLRIRLRQNWQALGDLMPLSIPNGRHQTGPMACIITGSEAATLEAANALRHLGLWVHPIRPPTVPDGASRLRITLSTDHTLDEISRLATALQSTVLRST